MHHTRVFDAGGGVYAFYDGRIDGYRFAPEPNWVDDGALSVGIASYAIVSGDEALVYDTHTSTEHARFVRDELESSGVTTFTIVLSHWHLDHVAGNAVFGDCEIIASERTGELLSRHKVAIESGELEGPPPIHPLILPTSVFADRMNISVGDVELELIHTNVHSDDATVVWLPHRRLLLCGDTMEDPITFVDEPRELDQHLANLEALRALGADRVLPNHGDPKVIAAGGYSSDLISATQQYISALQGARADPERRILSLRELIPEPLDAGWINYYEPYEAVHRHNLELVLCTPAAS